MTGRPLGFGIVGAGAIARFHALALQSTPEARVACFCDVMLERAQALAAEFGGAACASVEELVSRDDVDVVLVGTPSGLHRDPAVCAARAGKHVVVEKPIEVSLERADDIIRAAGDAGVLLSVVSQKRFEGASRALKEAVAAGVFGPLAFCDAYVKWWRSPDYYARSGWRGTRALDGGGALINQSIHTIDLALWIAGPVSSVRGLAVTRAHNIEVEDTAAAVVEYESGAIGVIQGSTACYPGHPATLAVAGPNGSARIEDGALVEWRIRDAEAAETEMLRRFPGVSGSGASDPLSFSHKGHALQFLDIIRAIRTGEPPLVSGRDGRAALELVLAIYESARSGAPVFLGRNLLPGG